MSSESLIDQYLAEQSGLTVVQIETLKLHKLVISGEITAKNAASSRSSDGKKGVPAGAYYRVLRQATRNVEQAVYTILLADRLGLLKLDDFRRLLDLISKSRRELDDSDAQQVISLLQALVNRIVML